MAGWVMPAYPGARVIGVPNSGHKSLERLKRMGALSYLVTAFVNGDDIDPDRLRFPEGTLERLLDDALDAFDAGRFADCAHLLDGDFTRMREANMTGFYFEAVARASDPALRAKLRERVASGVFDSARMKPKMRRRFATATAE